MIHIFCLHFHLSILNHQRCFLQSTNPPRWNLPTFHEQSYFLKYFTIKLGKLERRIFYKSDTGRISAKKLFEPVNKENKKLSCLSPQKGLKEPKGIIMGHYLDAHIAKHHNCWENFSTLKTSEMKLEKKAAISQNEWLLATPLINNWFYGRTVHWIPKNLVCLPKQYLAVFPLQSGISQ